MKIIKNIMISKSTVDPHAFNITIINDKQEQMETEIDIKDLLELYAYMRDELKLKLVS